MKNQMKNNIPKIKELFEGKINLEIEIICNTFSYSISNQNKCILLILFGQLNNEMYIFNEYYYDFYKKININIKKFINYNNEIRDNLYNKFHDIICHNLSPLIINKLILENIIKITDKLNKKINNINKYINIFCNNICYIFENNMYFSYLFDIKSSTEKNFYYDYNKSYDYFYNNIINNDNKVLFFKNILENFNKYYLFLYDDIYGKYGLTSSWLIIDDYNVKNKIEESISKQLKIYEQLEKTNNKNMYIICNTDESLLEHDIICINNQYIKPQSNEMHNIDNQYIKPQSNNNRYIKLDTILKTNAILELNDNLKLDDLYSDLDLALNLISELDINTSSKLDKNTLIDIYEPSLKKKRL